MPPQHLQNQITSDEWKQKLTPEQYEVLRQKGTEAPFTGIYYNSTEKGVYQCAACGAHLFSSDAKFDSGTGWPSFDRAIRGSVEIRDDHSQGMHRTEVVCARCGGHLGHVFKDGPSETCDRFCINSASLHLKP